MKPVDPHHGCARVFAVGDVHGHSKSLKALLRLLEVEAEMGPHDLLIFLGDYVDRGPDDAGVLELVLNLVRNRPNTVALLGNHDSWRITDKHCTPEVRFWLGQLPHYFRWRNYFFSHAPVYRTPPAEILARIPWSHWGGFSTFDDAVQSGYDFLNAFEGFNQVDLLHEPCVVGICGHVHHSKVAMYKNYIGIDTGCGFGGRLSAIELPSRRIFSVPELI